MFVLLSIALNGKLNKQTNDSILSHLPCLFSLCSFLLLSLPPPSILQSLFLPFPSPLSLSFILFLSPSTSTLERVSCTLGRSQAYDGARLVLNTCSSWGVGVTDKHCQDQLDIALSNIIILFEDQSLFLEWLGGLCSLSFHVPLAVLSMCIHFIFVYLQWACLCDKAPCTMSFPTLSETPEGKCKHFVMWFNELLTESRVYYFYGSRQNNTHDFVIEKDYFIFQQCLKFEHCAIPWW